MVLQRGQRPKPGSASAASPPEGASDTDSFILPFFGMKVYSIVIQEKRMKNFLKTSRVFIMKKRIRVGDIASMLMICSFGRKASIRSEIAVISSDFSQTACRPKQLPLSLLYAETICRTFLFLFHFLAWFYCRCIKFSLVFLLRCCLIILPKHF